MNKDFLKLFLRQYDNTENRFSLEFLFYTFKYYLKLLYNIKKNLNILMENLILYKIVFLDFQNFYWLFIKLSSSKNDQFSPKILVIFIVLKHSIQNFIIYPLTHLS